MRRRIVRKGQRPCAPAVLADRLRGLAQGNTVFVQQDLFLFQLGRKEEVFGQPPQKAHPLLQSGQEGRQGLRGRFQRVQSAGYREQRAAQVVEDVQHHALARLGLLGQGAGAVGHALVQLPRQLLGAVKLQGEPAADEGHAAQGEGNVVDAGTPHHIEADALREKGELQPRQNDQHPQADRCRAGEEEEQHRAVSPPVGRDEQPDAVGHAAQQEAGDEQREEQLAVTDEVLDGLDCADIPRLTVYNKCDKPGAMSFDPDILLTSAKTGYGLDTLLAKLDEVLSDRVHTLKVLLPYDKLGLAAPMRERGSVQVEEYREDGLYLEGIVKTEDLHCFEGYLV